MINFHAHSRNETKAKEIMKIRRKSNTFQDPRVELCRIDKYIYFFSFENDLNNSYVRFAHITFSSLSLFFLLVNKIIDYIIAFYMYYMDIDPGEEQYSTFRNAKTKK